jgi:glycosyltransferase involved in cell wall biosynthesis
MQMPWLSVIVPSHNGDRWIAAALKSVSDQNDAGIELIVVDSSEDDASLRIVNKFADELVLRTYRRPDLPSWTAKTNFGAEEARAPNLCMLHQDDLWLPGRALQIKAWLRARPDAVIHLHPAHIVDEAGRRRGTWRCPLPCGENPVAAAIVLERLLVQNFVAIPTPVIRRDAFLRVGGLDDRLWYTADWDLYLKLAAIGDFHYHPEPLACFRVHRGSQTVSGTRSLTDFRAQMEIVLDRHACQLQAGSRAATLRAAKTSILVNTALAAANSGNPAQLARAAIAVFGLGPTGMLRYLRDSRIVERSYPRLRARFAGEF